MSRSDHFLHFLYFCGTLNLPCVYFFYLSRRNKGNSRNLFSASTDMVYIFFHPLSSRVATHFLHFLYFCGTLNLPCVYFFYLSRRNSRNSRNYSVQALIGYIYPTILFQVAWRPISFISFISAGPLLHTHAFIFFYCPAEIKEIAEIIQCKH